MPDGVRNDLTIYDAVAAEWWDDRIPWVRTLRAMVPGRFRVFDRVVERWSGLRVLDLGCAGGFMAEALHQRGAQVAGIDPAERAIGAARARAAAMGHDIRYDVGIGEDLPYADEAFDAVVCVDVLEHVSDLRRVLAETRRVLKPGGLFMFDTINRNPLARLMVVTMAEDVLRLLPRGTHDPALFIRPSELRAALTRTGFAPGRITGLGPRGIDRRGVPVFGPLPLTAALYIGHARAI